MFATRNETKYIVYETNLDDYISVWKDDDYMSV